MKELKGIAASGGIAIAGVLRIQGENASGHYRMDPAESKKLYREIKILAHKEFGRLKSLSEGSDGTMSDLFESYGMIIEDPVFEEAVLGRLDAGATLFDAIKSSGEEMAAYLVGADDEYIRARSSDVIGVSDELIRQLGSLGHLKESADNAGAEDIDGSFVIVSRRLSPAQLMRIDKHRIEAICLCEGTPNDHTSILAGSMGIPCVTGLDPDLILDRFSSVIVDGNDGIVFLDPDEETVDRYTKLKDKILQRRQKARLRLLEHPLKDNGRIMKVCCNISSPDDIDEDTVRYADGVGLFRTEYLYLKNNDYPSEEEQFAAYSEALKKMKGKEVIIRTCDIGFDKAVDYMNLPHEQNPGMGIRGIRISLERPEMFRTQLRALYRASAYGSLSIMFPMISSLWELREARKYCEEVRGELESRGVKTGNVRIGIMIETPSAALLSADLAKEADFFSIGSNDLTQYTIGADRINADISRYYDAYHPAVRQLIAMTVKNAHKEGIPVGICGELASDPAMTEFFKETGIDELSVAPSRLLKTKLDLIKEE
ncbi:MAG: phosphoenolpyruvate--protein phosphotransferase [Lachnospiraceae bacterium]|nr:phosphoenolpyruvate--protein phosphotransferase [Lachnospiraceae bacterium]